MADGADSAMSSMTTQIQLYDLSANRVIVELPYLDELDFLDGDEIEIPPSLGTYRIVRRRWSLNPNNVVLVLLLEPLA